MESGKVRVEIEEWFRGPGRWSGGEASWSGRGSALTCDLLQIASILWALARVGGVAFGVAVDAGGFALASRSSAGTRLMVLEALHAPVLVSTVVGGVPEALASLTLGRPLLLGVEALPGDAEGTDGSLVEL